MLQILWLHWIKTGFQFNVGEKMKVQAKRFVLTAWMWRETEPDQCLHLTPMIDNQLISSCRCASEFNQSAALINIIFPVFSLYAKTSAMVTRMRLRGFPNKQGGGGGEGGGEGDDNKRLRLLHRSLGWTHGLRGGRSRSTAGSNRATVL